MNYKSTLDKLQKLCSQNKVLVKVATKVRNQANKVIGYSLAKTHLSHKNGEELILKQVSKKLQLIIDVGANKGEWTLLAKKYTSENACVHLIEPGIEAYKILDNLFANNNKIIAHHLGFSDINGELNFYEEVNAGEQSSFIVSIYHKEYQTVKVQVQTLDSFCQKNGITCIDLLKVDCEGFDYKVMIGAYHLLKENKIRYIQFEYGNGWKIAGSTLKAAINYLNSFGYEVWSVSETGLVKFDADYYGEYFEYTNFFAVNSQDNDFSILFK